MLVSLSAFKVFSLFALKITRVKTFHSNSPTVNNNKKRATEPGPSFKNSHNFLGVYFRYCPNKQTEHQRVVMLRPAKPLFYQTINHFPENDA